LGTHRWSHVGTEGVDKRGWGGAAQLIVGWKKKGKVNEGEKGSGERVSDEKHLRNESPSMRKRSKRGEGINIDHVSRNTDGGEEEA